MGLGEFTPAPRVPYRMHYPPVDDPSLLAIRRGDTISAPPDPTAGATHFGLGAMQGVWDDVVDTIRHGAAYTGGMITAPPGIKRGVYDAMAKRLPLFDEKFPTAAPQGLGSMSARILGMIGTPGLEDIPDVARAASRMLRGKKVFREASVGNMSSIIPGDNSLETTPLGNLGRFVTDDRNLALGQGTNKGVLIEMDAPIGQMKENKIPSGGIIGGKEYILTGADNREFQKWVRRVELSPDAGKYASKGEIQRFKGNMSRLVESGGWSIQTRPDKTIIWEKKK